MLFFKEVIMPQPTSTTPTTETAALVRLIMAKLGQDGITVGNAATGEAAPLPPQAAELVRQVLASLAAGRPVTVSENLSELTPNEAAAFLNVSRMHVMKLVHDGALPVRMVGSHHRIPYADLEALKRQERAKQRGAMDQLYALEREAGPVDGPPPGRDAFKSGGGRGA
jgi:excisionase family DNA binding protein